MKIYKGDAGIEITLDAFLELLEEDAIEEIVDMVVSLEATGSINGDINSMYGDYDGDMIYLGVLDMDEFDGDVGSLFDHITNNIEHYEVISEGDLQEFLESAELLEAGELDILEDVMDELLLSNEDLKVKRIVNRFRHIDDAS